MQSDPLALRTRGRPRETDAAKLLKAAAKTRQFRTELLSLLHNHNLEVMDLMAVLLFDYPGEVEDQSGKALRKRYVSKWLRGDSALKWPQEDDSTLWEHVLDALMQHPKNKEGHTTREYRVCLAASRVIDL